MTITIGIDPHKASHTAVAIDDGECVLDEYRLRACSDQADQLRAWAAPFPDRLWAIESARGLGYLLAQQLVAAGESVVDVPAVFVDTHTSVGIRSRAEERPERRPIGRDRGATQPGTHHVDLDDHAQVLKLLAKRHRDLAQSRAETASRLHALLMELQPGGMAKRMNVTRADAILDTISIDTAIVEHRVGVARELVADLVHIETR